MSGSQTWRLYVADNGDRYSIYVAKHLAIIRQNGNDAAFNGKHVMPVRDADYPPLPCGLAPRHAWIYPFERYRYPGVKPIKLIVSDHQFWARLARPYDGNFLLNGDIRVFASTYAIASSLVGERRTCETRIDDLGA